NRDTESSFMRFITALLAISLGFFPFLALGWESHFSLTYASLKNMAEIKNKSDIPAEELETLVEKEKTGWVKLLKEHEDWAKKNISSYAPLPDNLIFTAQPLAGKTLKNSLEQSNRINPEIEYPIFLQLSSDQKIQLHYPES